MGDSFSIGEGTGVHLPSQMTNRPSAESLQPKDKTGSADRSANKADIPDHDPEPMEPINFKNSRYQIKFDGETGQIFTDIVDHLTDTVVGRIPSYFKPSDETSLGGDSPEVATTDKRTVTI